MKRNELASLPTSSVEFISGMGVSILPVAISSAALDNTPKGRVMDRAINQIASSNRANPVAAKIRNSISSLLIPASSSFCGKITPSDHPLEGRGA